MIMDQNNIENNQHYQHSYHENSSTSESTNGELSQHNKDILTREDNKHDESKGNHRKSRLLTKLRLDKRPFFIQQDSASSNSGSSTHPSNTSSPQWTNKNVVNVRDSENGTPKADSSAPRSQNTHESLFPRLNIKKRLHPLRRSRSASGPREAPAHALFLREKAPVTRQKSQPLENKVEMCNSPIGMYHDFTKDQDKRKRQNLVDNVKNRIAMMVKKSSSNSLTSEVPPSKEEVISWANSFELLLNNQYGVSLFRKFLKTEFSEENLDFWSACDEYRKCKAEQRHVLALRIYTNYVAIKAPNEINLDSATRAAVKENIANPPPDIFLKAQKRIQFLMEKDSYSRFLLTDAYLTLLGKDCLAS